MKSIVIYGTRHGNTKRVAEAIGDGIRTYGPVEVVSVDAAPSTFAGKYDLVVVGGPTEGHSMTPAVKDFLVGLSRKALAHTAAAAFDTRLDWPRWMSGAAGSGIGVELKKLGADLVSPHTSFLVEGKDPVLKAGELERAMAWGDILGRAVRKEVAVAG